MKSPPSKGSVSGAAPVLKKGQVCFCFCFEKNLKIYKFFMFWKIKATTKWFTSYFER